MTEFELHLADAESQQRFGAELGRVLARIPHAAAVSVHLQGDLGTGKTTLVRGLLRGRGYTGPVRSPTFTLIEPYDTAEGPVYHLDLYRLGDGEELEYLGLRDLLAEPALLLIEWPERGAGWLPEPELHIQLCHAVNGRDLRLRADSRLSAEIAAAVSELSSEEKLRK